jgi:diguanylate cyclase
MISIKKHLENWSGAASNSVLGYYLALLDSFGKASARASDELGQQLEQKLTSRRATLEKQALDPALPEILTSAHRDVEAQLSIWADQAFEQHRRNESELREIIAAMAKAMDSIMARDERYKTEVGDLTARLQSITTMNDLTRIREAIVESAHTLTACVERTAESGKETLHKLKAEMADYRSRLSNSEKLSAIDSLTGLANRRRFEEQMETRIRAGHRFSLILIDLNEFKEVNDRLGHLAGDEVLKAVAAGLRAQFPSADLVARWGGDEFAVIVTCGEDDARARVARIRRTPIAECRVRSGDQLVCVTIHAAFGVVEWNGTEQGSELLSRADDFMYRSKQVEKTHPVA